jgi:hypothetical protein
MREGEVHDANLIRPIAEQARLPPNSWNVSSGDLYTHSLKTGQLRITYTCEPHDGSITDSITDRKCARLLSMQPIRIGHFTHG